MGLARRRSREKEKKKKCHTRSIFSQIWPRRGGASGYSNSTKFSSLIWRRDLITHSNFKLDRLRTGCVALHEILLSFRFSALHRLSPLTQLGPAGPLVIVTKMKQVTPWPWHFGQLTSLQLCVCSNSQVNVCHCHENKIKSSFYFFAQHCHLPCPFYVKKQQIYIQKTTAVYSTV